MKGGFRHLAAVVAASTFSVSLAAAPGPGNPNSPPPGTPTPGQVQSTLPTQLPQPKKAPPPSGSKAPNVQGVAPGGPAFRVNSFSIEGNTAIPTDELQAQISGYLGKDMTLSQLYDVADVLTRYYRAKGYGLAYVTPPAQKLSAGNVRLQVVEGRVGNIDIQGNSRTRTPVLRRRTEGLDTGNIYTNAAAERAVLLMNDIPGAQAREVLSPGQSFGTSDVMFNVDEHAFEGDVSVDDYGRASIGRWRLNADAAVNSLTGSGDQLSAGITHSEGNLLNFGKLAYLLPVGSASDMMVNFNRAFYHVGGPVFGSAHVEGSTQNAGLTWQYAAERSQAESLYWTLGLNHDTAKSLSGAGTASSIYQVTSNITLLQLGMLFDRQYQDQSYYTLSGNLWTNGQTNHPGVGANYAEKLRLQVDGSYSKPFADVWDFVGQASAAYSPDPLVDNDKYSLGGPGNVRGFQSAEARGDRGVFGSVELQRYFFLGSTMPIAWGLFLDSGKVWSLGFTPVGGTASSAVPASSDTLTSIGTEFQLLNNAGGWTSRLQFAWAIGGERPSDDVAPAAVALGEKPADRGPHIWFTLGKSF